MQRKFLGLISVDFNATGQLLIRYSAFVRFLKKKWEYSEAVHHLFRECKKAYYLFRREVMFNILVECGIPMKLVKGHKNVSE